MFNKYFTSLSKIPFSYVQLCSTQNIFNDIYCKYNVKDISKYSNNIFLRIEEFNQDGLMGTNICATSSLVGAIDIQIKNNEKNAYIEWYFVRNKLFCETYNNMYSNPIDNNEEKLIKKILFETAENIAITNDCKKIRLDTHQSLKFYNNNELKEMGFNLTSQRADDNSYWIITEKLLYK